MPAVYPGGVKVFTVKIDGAGNIVFAAATNDLQDEVNAVETGLLSGFAHVLRPDSTANNRDLGLSTSKWRNLFLSGDATALQFLLPAGSVIGQFDTSGMQIRAGTPIAVGRGPYIAMESHASGGAIRVKTSNAAGTADVEHFVIPGATNAPVGADDGPSVDFVDVAELEIINTKPGAGLFRSSPQLSLVGTHDTTGEHQWQMRAKMLSISDSELALRRGLDGVFVDLLKISSGGVLTILPAGGAIVLPADPTTALQAATKQYVDARFEGQAQNAASVTLLASGTTIVTLDLGTVIVNDLIYVSGQMDATKGATGGRMRLQVEKDSGTAVIKGATNTVAFLSDEPNHPASTTLLYHASGIFKVITGGTLILKVVGLSEGSDGTVAIGTGGLRAVVQRN